jgi:hypothetical protein
MLVGLRVTGHAGVPELCLPRAHRTRLCLATLPHWPQESMAKVAHHQHRRCCRCHGLCLATTPATTLLDSLADELLFLVLDHVAAVDPRTLKSLVLASCACRATESCHRHVLRPLHVDLLQAALACYPSATTLEEEEPTAPKPE